MRHKGKKYIMSLWLTAEVLFVCLFPFFFFLSKFVLRRELHSLRQAEFYANIPPSNNEAKHNDYSLAVSCKLCWHASGDVLIVLFLILLHVLFVLLNHLPFKQEGGGGESERLHLLQLAASNKRKRQLKSWFPGENPQLCADNHHNVCLSSVFLQEWECTQSRQYIF